MILEGRRLFEEKDLRVPLRTAERIAIRDVVQGGEECRVIRQADSEVASGIAETAVHGDARTLQ
jgi:hypothetical protein